MPNLAKVVSLSDVYRTHYPNPAEVAGVSDGQVVFKTYKSSWVNAEDCQWLEGAIGTPAYFMAPASGLGAACLAHCEMTGLPCFIVMQVTDSHFVSGDIMRAFKPVLERLGLADGIDTIARKPTFKAQIKEANQRQNTLFI